MRKFFSNSSGSVAITFAISLIALCGAAGVAIDLARHNSTQTSMQAAADTAALAASSDERKDKNAIIESAKIVFARNLPIELAGISPTIKAGQGSFEVTASYRMSTSLLAAIGITTMDVSVNSVATSARASTKLLLIVDNSSSMGIAADDKNRDLLMQLTKPLMKNNPYFASHAPNGCMFACHTLNGNGLELNGQSFYQMARQNGILLKEDVVADSLKTFLGDVMNGSGKMKASLIGFSEYGTWLAENESSLPKLIDSLASFPISDRKDTNFNEVFSWIEKEVVVKDFSIDTPVVLVTDGVAGDRASENFRPVDPEVCASFKRISSNFFIVDTQYEDFAGDYHFDHFVAPFWHDISPTLANCVGSSHYFKATSPGALADALQTITNDIKVSDVYLSK